jgi:hypothetical protein
MRDLKENRQSHDLGADEARHKIAKLVETFHSGRDKFLSAEYSEAQARIDFIDKFWTALGWDVNHEHQTNPYEQEVKVERGVPISGRGRRADYAFLAPNFRDVRFFVEAKRPGPNIDNPDDYFQLIRYGWNSHAQVSVLTSFEHFRVLDCRYRPDIDSALLHSVTDLSFHYLQYADPEIFARLFYLFSRQAVAAGSLDRYVQTLPKPAGKAVQRGLFPSGQLQPVDESFLQDLDDFRADLAKSFKRCNPRLDSEELTETTQRTLDRLVFMRFLEDKLIESEPIVESLGTQGSVWEDFLAASRRLDRLYNGIIFKNHALLDSSRFRIDGDVFEAIREKLAHINSPYDFHYIPIHILGSIYERFLGKVIVATDRTARIEPKPEARKAGGVYYTPQYVVRYIVENAIGNLIAEKSPEEIAQMRFADIACGSGSFLLGVYDALLRRHIAFYNAKGNRGRARTAGCVEADDGTLHLSLRQKRAILLNNVYGVDLDSQAVEVAQLSLYLKLLEEETTASARHYQLEFGESLLPSLQQNIASGNSLVDWDILDGNLFGEEEERRLKPLDFRAVFPKVFSQGGFDAIVGNPPYVQLSMERFRDEPTNAYLKNTYGFSGGRLNTFAFFFERARQLTRESGRIGYIVPNTITSQEYYETLRKKLVYGTDINVISLPIFQAFKEAVVENVVLICTNHRRESEKPPQNNVKFVRLWENGDASEEASTKQSHLLRNYKTSFAVPADPELQRLYNKLRLCKNTFGGCTQINQAIALKHDRAACLSPTRKSAAYHEVLDGRHIDRYFTGESPNYFKFDISKIHSCKREDIFLQKEKIFFRRVGDRLIGSLDTKRKYALNTLVVISPMEECNLSVRYMLGLFNSRLLNFFYFRFLKSSKKVFSEIQARQVAMLPLPDLDLEDADARSRHDQMDHLVDQVIHARQQLAMAQTEKDITFYGNKCTAVERQIDKLVYQLYGLTAEEIALVENSPPPVGGAAPKTL